MLILTDNTSNNRSIPYEHDINFTLPINIENIEISYDGGRFGVNINGKEIFYQLIGSNDFILELNNKTEL